MTGHRRWTTGLHRLTQQAEPHSETPSQAAARRAATLGRAVHERRTALGLSEAELGQRLGMTAEEVEGLEVGGMDPTLDLVEALTDALSADIVFMPGGTGPVVQAKHSAA